MGLFVAPATAENLERSIKSALERIDVQGLIPDSVCDEIEALASGEGIRCWAMTDGSKSQFDKMDRGDHVLFSQRGTRQFDYYGEVSFTLESAHLGDHLWPIQPRGTGGPPPSWKFIYFVRKVRPIKLSKSEFMTLLGHPTDNVAGVRKIGDDRLARFEAEHGALLHWLVVHAGLDADLTKKREPAPTDPPVALVRPAIPLRAVSRQREARVGLGTTYRRASSGGIIPGARKRLIEFDAVKLERGIRGHQETQDAFAEFLKRHEIVPQSPEPYEPDYDLAWTDPVTQREYVAEVKSTTPENEEKQLRLGLGQVLRYQQQLAENGSFVIAVLVPEHQPSDPDWIILCSNLGVCIAWPGEFERVLGLDVTGVRKKTMTHADLLLVDGETG